jgi:hypothetical protein
MAGTAWRMVVTKSHQPSVILENINIAWPASHPSGPYLGGGRRDVVKWTRLFPVRLRCARIVAASWAPIHREEANPGLWVQICDVIGQDDLSSRVTTGRVKVFVFLQAGCWPISQPIRRHAGHRHVSHSPRPATPGARAPPFCPHPRSVRTVRLTHVRAGFPEVVFRDEYVEP